MFLTVTTINAQTDDFFGNWGDNEARGNAGTTATTTPPELPYHDTPLGTGLFILGGLAAGYAVMKKKN